MLGVLSARHTCAEDLWDQSVQIRFEISRYGGDMLLAWQQSLDRSGTGQQNDLNDKQSKGEAIIQQSQPCKTKEGNPTQHLCRESHVRWCPDVPRWAWWTSQEGQNFRNAQGNHFFWGLDMNAKEFWSQLDSYFMTVMLKSAPHRTLLNCLRLLGMFVSVPGMWRAWSVFRASEVQYLLMFKLLGQGHTWLWWISIRNHVWGQVARNIEFIGLQRASDHSTHKFFKRTFAQPMYWELHSWLLQRLWWWIGARWQTESSTSIGKWWLAFKTSYTNSNTSLQQLPIKKSILWFRMWLGVWLSALAKVIGAWILVNLLKRLQYVHPLAFVQIIGSDECIQFRSWGPHRPNKIRDSLTCFQDLQNTPKRLSRLSLEDFLAFISMLVHLPGSAQKKPLSPPWSVVMAPSSAPGERHNGSAKHALSGRLSGLFWWRGSGPSWTRAIKLGWIHLCLSPVFVLIDLAKSGVCEYTSLIEGVFQCFSCAEGWDCMATCRLLHLLSAFVWSCWYLCRTGLVERAWRGTAGHSQIVWSRWGPRER